MAITTLDGVIAGAQPPESFLKQGATTEAVGVPHSEFYANGRPGAAIAPTPGINGAALTSYSGQIPFTNPVSGNTYLMRWVASCTQIGTLLLLDRLWHNSGVVLTNSSPQAITTPTFPARDKNGSTNGDDLLCAFEFSATGGAGTPTLTLTYTNEAGTGSRTSTFTGTATPLAGTFFMWPLQAGDKGIRSIQSVQLSATWTSGTAHMVVYRKLAQLDVWSLNQSPEIDCVTGGFVRLYDNTVPFIVRIPQLTTAATTQGQLIVTQG